MPQHNWLPPLTYRAGRTDDDYLSALNLQYQKDFHEEKIIYEDEPICIKRHPLINGYEATLWHLVTDNRHLSSDPVSDPRCEKLSWIKAILTQYDNEHPQDILYWENMRKGEKRLLHYLVPERYLVVLTQRNGYKLFWTAYPVFYKHEHKTLMEEHSLYQTRSPH